MPHVPPYKAHHRLTPHLSARELVRRQRWVFVGAGIIALLLVAMWIAALPGRIRTLGGNGLSGMAGQLPDREYIDIDKMLAD